MNIERALKLKPGDKVSCPADRGDPAFTGTVTHANANSKEICKMADTGVEYVWVEVQGPYHKSLWPSNRLG